MTQLNLFPDPEPLTCLCVDGPLKGQMLTDTGWPVDVKLLYRGGLTDYKSVRYHAAKWRVEKPIDRFAWRYLDVASSVAQDQAREAWPQSVIDAFILQYGKDEPSE